MLSAAVVPETDCSSTHVLCLCGGLGWSLLPCLLSSFGLSLSNLLRGFLCCNRPGFFSGLVMWSCELYLKRFVDSPHFVFQLGRFLFLCGFPRHLLYRSNLALTWCPRLRLCADVVFTLLAVLAIDTSSVRVFDFVLFFSLGFLARRCVGLDLLHLSLWELLSGCWCFWDTLSPPQPSGLRSVTRLFSALQLPSLSRSRD